MLIHCDLLGEKCVRAGPDAPEQTCKGCATTFHHACGAHVEGVEEYLAWDKCPYCRTGGLTQLPPRVARAAPPQPGPATRSCPCPCAGSPPFILSLGENCAASEAAAASLLKPSAGGVNADGSFQCDVPGCSRADTMSPLQLCSCCALVRLCSACVINSVAGHGAVLKQFMDEHLEARGTLVCGACLRNTFSHNSCWSPEHATAAEDAERTHPLVLAHRDARLNALFEARRDAAFAQRAQPPPREAQPSSPFRGADANAPPASSLQAQAAPDETETPPPPPPPAETELPPPPAVETETPPPPPPGSTPAPPAEASRQAREEARTPATKSQLQLGSLLLLKSRHAVARVTELGADGVRVVVHPAASMFWHLPDGDNGTRLTLPLDEAEAALLCAQPLDPASSGTRKTTCLFGVPNMAVLGQKKFAVAAQRTGHPRLELGGSCSLMEGVTAKSTAGVVLSSSTFMVFVGAFIGRSKAFLGAVLVMAARGPVLMVVPLTALCESSHPGPGMELTLQTLQDVRLTLLLAVRN